jgi:hypothetical protein
MIIVLDNDEHVHMQTINWFILTLSMAYMLVTCSIEWQVWHFIRRCVGNECIYLNMLLLSLSNLQRGQNWVLLQVKVSIFVYHNGHFFALLWIKMCFMSNVFYNFMKWDSIIWLLYNLIWYKSVIIWNQKFYVKWRTFNHRQLVVW